MEICTIHVETQFILSVTVLIALTDCLFIFLFRDICVVS